MTHVGAHCVRDMRLIGKVPTAKCSAVSDGSHTTSAKPTRYSGMHSFCAWDLLTWRQCKPIQSCTGSRRCAQQDAPYTTRIGFMKPWRQNGNSFELQHENRIIHNACRLKQLEGKARMIATTGFSIPTISYYNQAIYASSDRYQNFTRRVPTSSSRRVIFNGPPHGLTNILASSSMVVRPQ